MLRAARTARSARSPRTAGTAQSPEEERVDELGRHSRGAARARGRRVRVAPRARRGRAVLPRRDRRRAARPQDRPAGGGDVRGADLQDRGQRPHRGRPGGAGRDAGGLSGARAARPDATARGPHRRLHLRDGAAGAHRPHRRVAHRPSAGERVEHGPRRGAARLPRALDGGRRDAHAAAAAAVRAAGDVRRLGLPRRPEPLRLDPGGRRAGPRARPRPGPGGGAGTLERAQGPGRRRPASGPSRARDSSSDRSG